MASLQRPEAQKNYHWFTVRNTGGSTIPAWGLMRITGIDSTGPLQVQQPNADSQDVLVNGPGAIAAGEYGEGTFGFPIYAYYETSDGTPAVDETWGAGASSYKLRKNKTGFKIIGNQSSGIVLVRRTSGTGITSLNGLTDTTQTFSVTALGTDFTIASAAGVHTFDLPSASGTARGLVTTVAQEFAGVKKFIDDTYWLDGVGGNVIASIVPGATGLLLVSGDEIGTGSPTWVRLDLDQHNLNRCRLWSVDGGTTQAASYAVVGTGGTTHTGVWNTINPGDTVTVSGGLVTAITSGGSGSGSGSNVVSIKSIMPGGRLTLSSSLPVSTSNIAAGTILYYLPYMHNHLPLWDGSAWVDVEFSSIQPSLAALTSGKVADVFAYISAGVAAAELTLWTNATTRATGISYQDGRLCKTGDKTRLYLGTVANNSAAASLTIDDADTFRGVWNNYWRVPRRLKVTDSTNEWTTTTTAWHSLNSSTANRVSVVIGVEEVPVEFTHAGLYANSVSGLTGFVGIGLDSTSANSATTFAQGNVEGTSDATPLTASYKDFTGVGLHYLQLLEAAAASGTATFYGDGGDATKQQCGGLGWLMA